MTVWTIRATVLVLTAVGLWGCIDARSQYAPYEGYVPPPPNAPLPRPQYPINQDAAVQPAPAAPAAQPPASDGWTPRSAPSRGVDSQALPPVGDASRAPTAWNNDGRPLLLTSLVWRQGDDSAPLIHVARHHHLRPEVAPDKPARGRHGRKAAPATQTVTIKQGDTINSIARKFGTTPEAIMKANPDHSPKRLKLGAELKVPKPGAAADEQADISEDTTPAPRGRHGRERAHGRDRARDRGDEEQSAAKPSRAAKGYNVRHGDTLYSIAKRNDTTVDELKRANHLGSSTRLHSGQTLKLPGQEVEAAPAEEAPVRPARPARTPRARPHETESWTLPPQRPQPPTRQSIPGESGVSGSAFGQTPPAQTPPPAVQSPPPSSSGPGHPVPYTSLPGARTAPNPPAYSPPPYTPPPTYAPPPSSSAEGPASPSDAQVAAAGRGRFIWPTNGNVLSRFGPMPGGQRNDGVDIGAADGTPVRASATGDVVYAGNLVPGFGNLVLIKHEDGWVTAYAHLSKTEVKIKDHVSQGVEIGTVGSSGGMAQPQLHFEVRYAPSPRERARPVDPSLVLPNQ
jgi:murein DD-endopeptidase MepM/ murein hydrolase activator NlpD